MKVLDLFSGLGGFNQAFKDREHEVVTVDILEKFEPTIVADINDLQIQDLKKFGKFDVVLASPPCNCFSIASCSTHWSIDRFPKSDDAIAAIELVLHTMKLIVKSYPRYWILENPMGMLRKKIGLPVTTITQCQYGSNRMKPTDLWGVIPKSFKAKRCKNGDSCHEAAPRSSKTGTQGYKTKELRAKIPYGLSLAICVACEKDLKK